jgi:hypothetical protein
MRMLFIDYSSAFINIVPPKLITKLRSLELNTTLFNWIQVLRVGNNTITLTLTLNTVALQG